MSEKDTVRQLESDRLLRLLVFDEHDLDVISAHVQDAHVKREDLHYLPHEQRFVLALHRFDWEQEEHAPPQRRLTALHFEQVQAVRYRRLEQVEPDSLFTLLAIYFLEGDKPSGAIILEFTDGAAIWLEVECIEAQMKDLGPVWQTDCRPTHAEIEEQGGTRNGESNADKT